MLYILELPCLLGIHLIKLHDLETFQLINISPDANARCVSHSGAFRRDVEDFKSFDQSPAPSWHFSQSPISKVTDNFELFAWYNVHPLFWENLLWISSGALGYSVEDSLSSRDNVQSWITSDAIVSISKGNILSKWTSRFLKIIWSNQSIQSQVSSTMDISNFICNLNCFV